MITMPLISFIIPTLNEETTLPRSLESIRSALEGRYPYEIIVADNGSRDQTVRLAQQAGARVVINPIGTIAALRNRAARQAEGHLLVFLDADVILTRAWGEHFPQIVNLLTENPCIVTGSRCGVSRPASWIERYWFQPLLAEKARYINSGHLITTKPLFDRIGGFTESLVTGEDYNFSRKAAAVGATILNNPNLQVIHEGYPKSLRAFIQREVWHGVGAGGSIRSILRSPTASASLLFSALHAAVPISLFLPQPRLLLTASLASIVLLCLMASAAKYRPRPLTIMVNSFLYYCYFWGRSLALFSTALGRPVLAQQRR